MEIRPGDVLFTFIPEWETVEDCNIIIITKIIASGEEECLVKRIKYLEEDVERASISFETKVVPLTDFQESYIVEENIWKQASSDLEIGQDYNYYKIKKQFKELIEYLYS